MPQVQAPMSTVRERAPSPKRWTRRECDFLRSNGLLTERYELIDGEVVSKTGQNPPHGLAIVLLQARLISVFGPLCVRIQLSVDVGGADPEHNEPDPDIAVTERPGTAYPDRHPGPADLLLIAEVADTTLRYDRTTKANLYARAGIREYRVIDTVGRQAVVHRQPGAEGYAEVVAYASDETVATLARPEQGVLVADLLPPPA
jgi:Uma2 family endonuclease